MPPPPRQTIDLAEGSIPTNQERIKVFSYNILCDNATRSQYNYTPSAALAWDFRRNQILQEIQATDADIVCLQEVDVDSFNEFFSPKLSYNNWKGAFWPKSRAKTMTEDNAKMVDGCATFYRVDRYYLLDKHLLDFSHYAVHSMEMKGPQAADIYNRIMPRDQMAVLTFLENRRTGSRLIVANGHLYWDPAYPDVKLIQTAILMDCVNKNAEKYAHWPAEKTKKMYKLADEDINPDIPIEPIPENVPSMKYEGRTQIPLIMCLDLNSTSDSSAYEFLAKGHIPPDHVDLKNYKYGQFSTDGIEHPFNLRSAYSLLNDTPDELKFTNYTPGFVDVIDHIFYSANTLETVSLLGGVDAEYMKTVPGFPNYHFPSDHLSLLVEFTVKPRKEKKSLPEPDFGSSSRRGRNE
jgi:CCR4-NOT transcription complex subunit 6